MYNVKGFADTSRLHYQLRAAHIPSTGVKTIHNTEGKPKISFTSSNESERNKLLVTAAVPDTNRSDTV